MYDGEPPSESKRVSPLFLIGKDSQGHWVVQDQSGLKGGIFVDRTAALKFAMFENGHRPEAIVMIPGVFELDMSSRSSAPAHAIVHKQADLRRAA